MRRLVSNQANLLFAALIALSVSSPAFAAGNDSEVEAIIEGIMESEYSRKKYGDALEKLGDELKLGYERIRDAIKD